MYFLSDVLCFLFKNVLRYRRKVITDNLKRCFPQASQAEIAKMRSDFYTHFTDILLEGIKALGVPPSEIEARFKVLNVEVANDMVNKKGSIIVSGAHFSNWEWVLPTVGKLTACPLTCLYKPLNNKRINDFLRSHTERNRIEMTSIKETAKLFKRSKTENLMHIVIADQSPSNTAKAIRADFFGTNIPCLHGLEVYAREYELPVLYAHIRRVKRGSYELFLSVLSENPQEMNSGELTQLYMNTLAAEIIHAPEQWLWSHKRWKRL